MTRIAAAVGGNRATSSKVKLWVPGRDGTGAATDLQGGAGFTAAVGNDTMWAQDGYFQAKATGIGTDGACSFGTVNPLATWDIQTESLLIAMQIKAPVHGAASRSFGNTPGNTGGIPAAGIALGSVTNLARLGPRIYDGVNHIGTPEWGADVLDDTVHSIIWFLDAGSKTQFAWIDSTQVTNGSLSYSGITGSVANSTEPLRIGRVGATTVNTRQTAIRNLQIAIVTGSIPANYDQLKDLYLENPFRPWSAEALS